jgi:hypothetical protein
MFEKKPETRMKKGRLIDPEKSRTRIARMKQEIREKDRKSQEEPGRNTRNAHHD